MYDKVRFQRECTIVPCYMNIMFMCVSGKNWVQMVLPMVHVLLSLFRSRL